VSLFLAVNLGTLPQWLTIFIILGLAGAVRSGQLGPALGYLRDANATLTQENTELKKQLAEQVALVVSLRARTDLKPLETALLAQLTGHERRAEARFEKTCAILDLIADRLGPEPDADDLSRDIH
jgi:hypothetical protein